MSARTWWRWERDLPPDGYDSTHFGSLVVRSGNAPPRDEGWEHVKVRYLGGGHLEYLAREAW